MRRVHSDTGTQHHLRILQRPNLCRDPRAARCEVRIECRTDRPQLHWKHHWVRDESSTHEYLS